MRWTNRSNLPQPLASAIQYDPRKKDPNRFSVTELLRPPRMAILERRHQDEITEDVADHVWRLLGQSVHAVLEKADTTDHLSEEKLSIQIGKSTIVGVPDLLDSNGILDDYKCTSVYSFLLGDKIEWGQQLNLYALLYRKHGFTVKRLRIVAILRDWQSSRARREKDYPQAGVIVKEINLWSTAKQMALLNLLLVRHRTNALLKDDDLPHCTAEERWERPNTWAVKKKGNKKAWRVFDSEAKAETAKKDGMVIEFRPGESVRCARFCRVAPFCNQWKNMQSSSEEKPVLVKQK